MGLRRKARELVLQNLYALEISGNSLETAEASVMEASGGNQELSEFASVLLRRAFLERETLDGYIRDSVKNWRLERIALIDRLILRMALAEILFFEEIPPKVSLDEAIDLAKKYSTEESGRFVNGVLDALLKRLKQENRVIKRGRGLLE